MTDASKLELRTASELASKYNTTLRTSVEVTSVDLAQKAVVIGNERVSYETLVLATGATPRKLPIAGKDLTNVFRLRGVDDAKKIDAGKSGYSACHVVQS